MKVFEILLKVCLLEDIELKDAQTRILKFIDTTLGRESDTLTFHYVNSFKNYCFNSFYPLETDGVYKKGNVYTITIRTIDNYLADYFNNKLSNSYMPLIMGLDSSLKVIPIKKLKKMYSITPLVIKNDEGYWRNLINFIEFEKRLKFNLLKKYNCICNTRLNKDFRLYSSLEFKNKMPIASKYKGKTLLGDKISINILEDDLSQKIAYMALGTGFGEMNARGFGFMGYRWE